MLWSKHLTNIFTVDFTGWLSIYLELSPPKPLDQSKNVTVRTFHIWPKSVHEHIFLGIGGPRGPRAPWHWPEQGLCNYQRYPKWFQGVQEIPGGSKVGHRGVQ